jgi:hypothetical protein
LFGRIFATQTGAHFAGKCSREAVKLPSPKRELTAAEILEPRLSNKSRLRLFTAPGASSTVTKIALALLHNSNHEPEKTRENRCASQLPD